MCTKAAGWSFTLLSLTVLACTLSKELFLIRCVNSNTQVENKSYFQHSAISLLFTSNDSPRQIALFFLLFSPPPPPPPPPNQFFCRTLHIKSGWLFVSKRTLVEATNNSTIMFPTPYLTWLMTRTGSISNTEREKQKKKQKGGEKKKQQWGQIRLCCFKVPAVHWDFCYPHIPDVVVVVSCISAGFDSNKLIMKMLVLFSNDCFSLLAW